MKSIHTEQQEHCWATEQSLTSKWLAKVIIKVEEGKTSLFSRRGRSERKLAYYGGTCECMKNVSIFSYINKNARRECNFEVNGSN